MRIAKDKITVSFNIVHHKCKSMHSYAVLCLVMFHGVRLYMLTRYWVKNRSDWDFQKKKFITNPTYLLESEGFQHKVFENAELANGAIDTITQVCKSFLGNPQPLAAIKEYYKDCELFRAKLTCGAVKGQKYITKRMRLPQG